MRSGRHRINGGNTYAPPSPSHPVPGTFIRGGARPGSERVPIARCPAREAGRRHRLAAFPLRQEAHGLPAVRNRAYETKHPDRQPVVAGGAAGRARVPVLASRGERRRVHRRSRRHPVCLPRRRLRRRDLRDAAVAVELSRRDRGFANHRERHCLCRLADEF